jgi:Ca-activated chloride channel family protein
VTFAYPELLAIAILAPLVVLGLQVVDELRRTAIMRRLGHVPQIRRMAASASTWRRWTKAGLLAVGLAAITAAAARPQVPGQRDGAKQGLDVVIALDVSKSMLATDVAPSRLARARAYIAELLPRLTNDRVSAMVFAGAAAHFPLSDDKDVALQFLNDLGPSDLPGGSDLREVVRTGTCVLRPETSDRWGARCAGVRGRGHGGDPLEGEPEDTPVATVETEVTERSKVLVIFTDGADRDAPGDGVVGVAAEVAQAKQLGVTVFVVGVGTAAGANVPDLDDAGRLTGRWKLDANGQPVRSVLEAAGLRELAELGGDASRYLELGAAPTSTDALVVALEALTRGTLERKDERVMEELFTGFLFVGFMLLVIEACLGTRRRLRFPEG